jgi:hypothetical protein
MPSPQLLPEVFAENYGRDIERCYQVLKTLFLISKRLAAGLIPGQEILPRVKSAKEVKKLPEIINLGPRSMPWFNSDNLFFKVISHPAQHIHIGWGGLLGANLRFYPLKERDIFILRIHQFFPFLFQENF